MADGDYERRDGRLAEIKRIERMLKRSRSQRPAKEASFSPDAARRPAADAS